MGDAKIDDRFDGRARHLVALEVDAAGPDPDHAGERAKQRCLAGAVGSHQGDDLVGFHIDAHVPQDLDAAISRVQVAHLQQAQLDLRSR